jgi:hypothetical protein
MSGRNPHHVNRGIRTGGRLIGRARDLRYALTANADRLSDQRVRDPGGAGAAANAWRTSSRAALSAAFASASTARRFSTVTKAGHADMRTTKHYLHLAGVVFRDEAEAWKRLLGAFAAIPPRDTSKTSRNLAGDAVTPCIADLTTREPVEARVRINHRAEV